jgi:hypothetical protein
MPSKVANERLETAFRGENMPRKPPGVNPYDVAAFSAMDDLLYDGVLSRLFLAIIRRRIYSLFCSLT